MLVVCGRFEDVLCIYDHNAPVFVTVLESSTTCFSLSSKIWKERTFSN